MIDQQIAVVKASSVIQLHTSFVSVTESAMKLAASWRRHMIVATVSTSRGSCLVNLVSSNAKLADAEGLAGSTLILLAGLNGVRKDQSPSALAATSNPDTCPPAISHGR